MLEVVFAIAFLIPCLILLADLYFLLDAAQANETVCRNAARAAAHGDPKEAGARASTAVGFARRNKNALMVCDFELIEPLEFNKKADEEPGSVTVTTLVRVRSILLHHLIGGKATDSAQFRAKQTYPISFAQIGRETY